MKGLAQIARIEEILDNLAGMRWKGEPISTPHIAEELVKLRAEVRNLAGLDREEARCVIAATVESMDTGSVDANGRSQYENRPVAILDDGSAYRLNSDGEWRKLRPVPSTFAGLEWKKILDAKRAEPDDMEE